MSVKGSDLARIQEIWDVGVQTRSQIASLGFTRNRFLEPQSDVDDLIGESIMNRVLRITEEAGRISEEVAKEYGFERQAASGVRNRLVHAYGEVDREIIWQVLECDLPALLKACQSYCDDQGLDLS